MNKNIFVLSTSPRQGGNSETLADEFIRGAKEAGNQVEKACLYDKAICFCQGCLACLKTHRCVIHDGADVIAQKMRAPGVLVFEGVPSRAENGLEGGSPASRKRASPERCLRSAWTRWRGQGASWLMILAKRFKRERSGDMKRMATTLCGLLLAFSLSGCADGAENERPAVSSTVSAQSGETASTSAAQSSEPVRVSSAQSSESEEASAENGASVRQIQITAADGRLVTFALNDSAAADSLYRQLPLSVTVEDFGGSEKIFYPPEKLDTRVAPPAQGPAGTLAYYEPWGNVAMFYGECGGASGLYALGEALIGADIISELSGEIQIESVDEPPVSSEALESESTSAHQSQTSSTESPSPRKPADEISSEEDTAMELNVQIGNRAFTATLEENAAARSFVELIIINTVLYGFSSTAVAIYGICQTVNTACFWSLCAR